MGGHVYAWDGQAITGNGGTWQHLGNGKLQVTTAKGGVLTIAMAQGTSPGTTPTIRLRALSITTRKWPCSGLWMEMVTWLKAT